MLRYVVCITLPKERCFWKGQWFRRRHTVPISAFVKSPLPQGLPDLHQWSLEDVSLTGRFPQMSLEGDSAGAIVQAHPLPAGRCNLAGSCSCGCWYLGWAASVFTSAQSWRAALWGTGFATALGESWFSSDNFVESSSH